jgi:hypothetical protein
MTHPTRRQASLAAIRGTAGFRGLVGQSKSPHIGEANAMDFRPVRCLLGGRPRLTCRPNTS